MVPIDNVYKTVLNILNKENRGYITPTEFNTLAKQAQTEIFEHYFTAQYRAQQGPMSDGDYSDVVMNFEEKITFFDNTTDMPLTRMGQIAQYPDNFYRLGTVFTSSTTAAQDAIHVPEISHKDALYINKSPLTAPTAKQPIYTRHEGGIRVYPDDTDVNMVYVRIPATPNWVGASLNGQIVPNEADADYQNFELHPSEEPELIAKILAYSGVIIRAQDITQVGAAKEQQIIQDHG